MNTNIFPFQIGEQYEEYEFELNFYEIQIIRSYEYVIYEYIGLKVKSILGFKFSKKPLLYYNADVLARVDYFLNNDLFDNVLNNINYYLSVTNKLNIDPFANNNPAFCKTEKLIIELLRNSDEDVILRISNNTHFI